MRYTPAVPALIKLVADYNGKALRTFNNDSAALALYAVIALGEIGDERAIPVLVSKMELWGESDFSGALAKFGPKVLPQMLAMIRESPLAILMTKPKDAWGQVNTVEDLKASRVGKVAAGVINQMQDKTLLPQLWVISLDLNDPASWAAYVMITRIADRTTTPTITEIGNTLVQRAEQDLRYRPLAIMLSVDVKYPEGIPYLIRLLENRELEMGATKSLIMDLGLLKGNAQGAVPVLEKMYARAFNPKETYDIAFLMDVTSTLSKITQNASYAIGLFNNAPENARAYKEVALGILGGMATEEAITALRQIAADARQDAELREQASSELELVKFVK